MKHMWRCAVAVGVLSLAPVGCTRDGSVEASRLRRLGVWDDLRASVEKRAERKSACLSEGDDARVTGACCATEDGAPYLALDCSSQRG